MDNNREDLAQKDFDISRRASESHDQKYRSLEKSSIDASSSVYPDGRERGNKKRKKLTQWWPTRGTRAICGTPGLLQWHAEDLKIFQKFILYSP